MSKRMQKEEQQAAGTQFRCSSWLEFLAFILSLYIKQLFTRVHPTFLGLSKLEQSFEINRLWSLDWQSESSVPDELCQWTETSADTESGSVVERVVETVVVEEHTRTAVNIGERILGFAVLSEDAWSDLTVLLHQLEDWVFGNLFAR